MADKADKTVSIADAKVRLHAIIREGVPVALTSRGVVVARIIPVKAGDRQATPPKEHATDTRQGPVAPRRTRDFPAIVSDHLAAKGHPKPKPIQVHATAEPAHAPAMQVDATATARRQATAAQAQRDSWLRKMHK